MSRLEKQTQKTRGFPLWHTLMAWLGGQGALQTSSDSSTIITADRSWHGFAFHNSALLVKKEAQTTLLVIGWLCTVCVPHRAARCDMELNTPPWLSRLSQRCFYIGRQCRQQIIEKIGPSHGDRVFGHTRCCHHSRPHCRYYAYIASTKHNHSKKTSQKKHTAAAQQWHGKDYICSTRLKPPEEFCRIFLTAIELE